VDADLVLEGGGVKGIGLVGAYTRLTDAGYAFHRIAGTSAGAIVGSLIAAGMQPEQLKKVMREVDYGRFQDEGFIDHLGMAGKGLSLLFERGIYEGNYLRESSPRSSSRWASRPSPTFGSTTRGARCRRRSSTGSW
jgi:NTE family protein